MNTVKEKTLHTPLPQRDEYETDQMDWKWQQRNALKSVEDINTFFPGIPKETLVKIDQANQHFNFQITPYYASLIKGSSQDGIPTENHPLWKQVMSKIVERKSDFDYDGEQENWENDDEMVTPICQHKYDNRVIIRLSNTCHAYCQFCYEALRTLKKDSNKSQFKHQLWKQSMDYIQSNDSIEEVILSGGEPFMQSDDLLERVFDDLRSIRENLLIRIHTRSLTFNPYRITTRLLSLIKKYKINAIGIHVSHPDEISLVFKEKVNKLLDSVPVLFANIPLLKSINDDEQVMRTLWMNLYRIGVVPHYLYHFMPFSPGSERFRTDVMRGVEIVSSLKRRISNIAVPEYVLPHYTGKFSMPILQGNGALPKLITNKKGQQVLEFVNWKGEQITYPV